MKPQVKVIPLMLVVLVTGARSSVATSTPTSNPQDNYPLEQRPEPGRK